MIVPEIKDDPATGITLLHVRFHDHLPRRRGPRCAAGLPEPLGRLRDAVTETEPTFREDLLEQVPDGRPARRAARRAGRPLAAERRP